jgi:hypothetical protein
VLYYVPVFLAIGLPAAHSAGFYLQLSPAFVGESHFCRTVLFGGVVLRRLDVLVLIACLSLGRSHSKRCVHGIAQLVDHVYRSADQLRRLRAGVCMPWQ